MAQDQNSEPIAEFSATAKIGQVMGGIQALTLSPQDLSSPVSLQMALTRIMDSLAKLSTSQPEKKWIAEVRFTDSLGNPISIAVDLGPMPPLEATEYRARVKVELLSPSHQEVERGERKARMLVASDPHSNVHALKAVLEAASKDRYDASVMLGDLVGYCAWPEDVLTLVRAEFDHVVMGNHDYAVSSGDYSGMNLLAKLSDQMNARALLPQEKAYLGSLPRLAKLQIDGRTFMLVHGSPRDPLFEYVYPNDVPGLPPWGTDILLLGHTHVPFWTEITCAACGHRIVLNPGSVGQPRDGDPRASYAILELSEGELRPTVRRVKYDAAGVAISMKRLGYPPQLAERLLHGLR
ncbi:MAG: metallophosphoesterase family protein [TACK group archaeon]|nr:metallophosphoesterase family protein [TACK group archaeon]